VGGGGIRRATTVRTASSAGNGIVLGSYHSKVHRNDHRNSNQSESDNSENPKEWFLVEGSRLLGRTSGRIAELLLANTFK
jgi:hypothetical protein